MVVLSLIPVISGSLRLVEIAGDPQLMPDNPRIDASPAPDGATGWQQLNIEVN